MSGAGRPVRALLRMLIPALIFLLVQFGLCLMPGLLSDRAPEPEALRPLVSCALLPVSLLAWRFLPAGPGAKDRRSARLLTAGLGLAAAVLLVLNLTLPGRKADWLPLAGLCIAGPVNEEIVYRSFVLRLGQQRLRSASAVFWTAALFAAAHPTFPGCLIAFAAGIPLGYAAVWSGGPAMAAVLHIIWNLAVNLA